MARFDEVNTYRKLILIPCLARLDDFGEFLLELELNPFGQRGAAAVGSAIMDSGVVDLFLFGIVARKAGDNRYIAKSDR